MRGGGRGHLPPPPTTGLGGTARVPRFGHFNVFSREKIGILTKIDTFEHAVEGGPAPREGAQKGKGAPRLAAPPLVQPSAGLERERERERGGGREEVV